jgi:hypothetical protein
MCTYNLVKMQPRERQQVQVSWCSHDGCLAAHSGDDRAPGSAAVSAVSLASSSVRSPVASPYGIPSLKPNKTAVMKARETTLCILGSAKQSMPGVGGGNSNKTNPAGAGNGRAPVWYHKL